jgi:hypothetical protein
VTAILGQSQPAGHLALLAEVGRQQDLADRDVGRDDQLVQLGSDLRQRVGRDGGARHLLQPHHLSGPDVRARGADRDPLHRDGHGDRVADPALGPGVGAQDEEEPAGGAERGEQDRDRDGEIRHKKPLHAWVRGSGGYPIRPRVDRPTRSNGPIVASTRIEMHRLRDPSQRWSVVGGPTSRGGSVSVLSR